MNDATQPDESTDIPDSQAAMAQIAPRTVLDKVLAVVPRALSSHAHIIFLGFLGIYLVLLPLVGVDVSAKAELIGGKYTNVTSDLGACIAAGLTVHLVRRDRQRTREMHDWFSRVHRQHEMLHQSIDQVLSVAERMAPSAGSRRGDE